MLAGAVAALGGYIHAHVSSDFTRLRLWRLILWPIAAAAVVAIVAIIPPRAEFGASMTAAFVAVYAALLLAGVSACRVAGIPVGDVLGPLPRDGRPWFRAALLGPLVLAFSAASMWATVFVASSVSPEWAARQLAGGDDPMTLIERLSTTQRYLLAALAVVVAPMAEEFAFRGLLMRRWMAKRGFWTGLIGSAALFAVLHPPNWIGAFVFSLVAGALYLWSGSLALPIIVHAINNAFVALALFAQQLAPAETQAAPTIAEFRSGWIGPLIMLLVIGASIVAVTLPLLLEARRRTEFPGDAPGP